MGQLSLAMAPLLSRQTGRAREHSGREEVHYRLQLVKLDTLILEDFSDFRMTSFSNWERNSKTTAGSVDYMGYIVQIRSCEG